MQTLDGQEDTVFVVESIEDDGSGMIIGVYTDYKIALAAALRAGKWSAQITLHRLDDPQDCTGVYIPWERIHEPQGPIKSYFANLKYEIMIKETANERDDS